MTASSIPMPRLPSAAVAAAAVWFGLALLAGATGFLARLPFPGPQLIILTLVVATFAAGTLVPALRDWIGALPLRALIQSRSAGTRVPADRRAWRAGAGLREPRWLGRH